MKFLFTVIAAVTVTYAFASDECYKDSVRACKLPRKDIKKDKKDVSLPSCSAEYGAIHEVLPDLQRYVNSHITRNFEYMLMATHYGNYENSRKGFEKLFMDLSDAKWEAAIDLIKYITKRGGEMKFENVQADTVNYENAIYELYELNSLAKALDMEKELAERAHQIHGETTRRREKLHDPEVSSHIENEFVHKQAKTIRKLSGYTSDLTSLLNGPDSTLALYIFDEYLQKHSIV